MEAQPIADVSVYNAFHYVGAVQATHSIFPFSSYDGRFNLDAIMILGSKPK